MDRAAVTEALPANPARKVRPSWRLKAPHDSLTQGLAVSGFASLPTGRALFLQFCWDGAGPGGGAWLRALHDVAPISDASGRDARAAALSFSYTGLQKMGLPDTALASFARPFQEGMYQEDRLRRIGDRVDGVWQETVIPGGPLWSANTPLDEDAACPKEAQPFDVDKGDPAPQAVATPVTVHALLLLYEKDDTSADAWAAEVEATLAPHEVRIVHRLPLELDLDEKGIGREHFGFADGLSQPIPFDDQSMVLSTGAPVPHDKWNGVPLGEVLFGHVNGHREVASGPVVPAPVDGAPGDVAGLSPHPQAEGFFDFGLDGSYMVVRELKQDVVAFWDTMEKSAERVRLRDPQASAHVDAQWLAERVVGRDRDGHLLCPTGTLKPDEYDQPQNAFGFLERDPHGGGCPVGSHVRRANPRDSLAPKPSMAQTLLDAANNHRILRRGRKFGARMAWPPVEDGVDRGLLFICLNADIARQFEFVQQTWLLNANFGTLFDETDPLLGPKGKMTIRDIPLRRRVDVATFVQMAGGDYFFLPSMPALRYLASL